MVSLTELQRCPDLAFITEWLDKTHKSISKKALSVRFEGKFAHHYYIYIQ